MSPGAASKTLHVALAAIAGIALIGFLAGTGTEPQVSGHGGQPPRPAHPAAIPDAPRYAAMSTRNLGRNAPWDPGRLDVLRPRPERRDQPPPQEATDAALADRAGNRAYAGAPPTVPHPIEQRSAASCLACHRDGLVVERRRASKISHPPYRNCTQCHVAAAPQSVLDAREPPPQRQRPGTREAASGPRAWPGAPPQIPHGTWMREDCRSCHGPAGRPGLQTSHPERHHCQQCHTAPAHLDQRFTPPPPTPAPADAP